MRGRAGIFSRRGKRKGIGRLKERSLHAALVEWYSVPTDEREAKAGRYVVDLMRNGMPIEIQTCNFWKIRTKLQALSRERRVRLVYPIARRKWIARIARRGGRIIRRRRSPREGRPADVFYELTALCDLIGRANLSLDILMIEEEEIRRDDGKGSWRRKGVSIVDRRLVSVLERIELEEPRDFLLFLPRSLGDPFTNRDLGEAAGMGRGLAGRVTYCLRKMGVVRVKGRRGRGLLFTRTRFP